MNLNLGGSSSGGLFGNSNNNSSNSGGLFGNSNNNNNSGGLFGNSNNNNNKSGGLFGSSNNNNSSGGLLGNNNSNNNSSGGLFGNNNNNNNKSGGLFGNSNSNNSGGLFGNNNKSGGLFGSSNNNSSGGLFGNNNNNSSGGLFGNNNNNNKTNSLFGGSSQGTFSLVGTNNSNQVNFPQISSNSSMSVSSNPVNEIKRFTCAYNPSDKDFQFDAILYNLPAKNLNAKQYVKPNNVNHHLWEQAQKQNPEPSKLTPVFIKGFEQLHKRANFLVKSEERTRNKKLEFLANIRELKEKNLKTKRAVTEIKKKQLDVSLKLLKVVKHLIVKHNSNKPLTHNENVFRQRIKRMGRDLQTPNKFCSRNNELVSMRQTSGGDVPTHLQLDIQEVGKVLKKQSNMIREMVKCMQQDQKVVAEILEHTAQRSGKRR